MHYLTVQDVLWIHLQIAKKPGVFKFAKLEEATNYQYAYGKSKDVLGQASRFMTGFVSMSPFDDSNLAVAFVAGIVFLELNGFHVKGSGDLVNWFVQASNPALSRSAIESQIERAHGDHHATSRAVADSVIARYESTINQLLN